MGAEQQLKYVKILRRRFSSNSNCNCQRLGGNYSTESKLDSASQNNLITESAVQRLQLRMKHNQTRVYGLVGTEVQEKKACVNYSLKSKNR